MWVRRHGNDNDSQAEEGRELKAQARLRDKKRVSLSLRILLNSKAIAGGALALVLGAYSAVPVLYGAEEVQVQVLVQGSPCNVGK